MTFSSHNRRHIIFACVFILFLVTLVFAPLSGMSFLPVHMWFSGIATGEGKIFWYIRLPRFCLAFLAGESLALSGMVFQAIFRNPLASPFSLGVASGASLGAAISIRLGWTFSLLSLTAPTLAAFTGALLVTSLVFAVSRLRRDLTPGSMLLTGVAISFFFSSLLLLIHFTSTFHQSFSIFHWLMGGLETEGFATIFHILPFVVSGNVIIFFLHRELDLILCGDLIALSRGMELSRYRQLLFLATSLMVGGVVAVCGPIGFVGIMIPHICRLLIGPGHRLLAPLTAIIGGIFLAWCDVLAGAVLAPVRLPIGILTNLLGVPFFLYLLLRPSR